MHGTMPGTVTATSPVGAEAQFVGLRSRALGPSIGPSHGLRLGPAVPDPLRASSGLRHTASGMRERPLSTEETMADPSVEAPEPADHDIGMDETCGEGPQDA